MKKFKLFKTGFCEKLKLLLIPIGLLIGSVTTPTWAWYYIVGDEALTGYNWHYYEEDTKMTGTPNSVTFMARAAGTYKFKMYKKGDDGTWGGLGGSIHSASGTAYDSHGQDASDNNNLWIKTNEVANITFTLYGSDQVDITVTKCAYYIKYPWNGGAYGWSGDMKSNGDGTYSVHGQYGGRSYNYGRKNSDGGADSGFMEDAITTTDATFPDQGDVCIFTYTPSDHSLSVRRASEVTSANYFYFDNSIAQWNEDYTYFAFGTPERSTMYGNMAEVGNTKLLYGSNGGDNWTDVSYYAMAAGDKAWDLGHDWNYPAIADWTKNSAPYLTKFDLGSGDICLIGKASASDGSPISLMNKGTSTSSLNSTQTIKYALAKDGTPAAEASVMSSGSTPAAIEIASYKFSNGTYDAVAASSSPAKSMSASGTTYSDTEEAGYTAETTITVSSINSDYSFKGFYTAASGGDQLTDEEGDENDYVYYPKEATTIFARFVALYTVAYNANGGTGTLPTKGAGKKESGTDVVLGNNNNSDGNGNISKSGYTLAGWNTAADCTGDDYEKGGTLEDVSKAVTLYAKWTQDIALDLEGGTTGSTSLAATYNKVLSTAGFTAPTRGGYTFAGYWTGDNGTGSMVIDDEGEVQIVASWVDSDGKWIHDGASTLYAKWTPKALTFSATTDGNWNTASNWTESCKPTKDHDITISAPVTVNTNAAVAKSIAFSGTGKITIPSDGVLEVAGTIDNSIAANIVINTTSSSQGALIYDISTPVAATVNMTMNNASSGFQLIASPTGGASVASDFFGEGVYTYAWVEGKGWERRGYYETFVGEAILVHGQTSCNFSGYLSTTCGGSLAYTDKPTLASAQGVNMLVNPLSAPIKVSAMTLTNSADNYVSVWNNGVWAQYSTASGENVVPAFNGYAVIASSSGSVSFTYDTAVRGASTKNAALKAPKQNTSEEQDHITISVTTNGRKVDLPLYEDAMRFTERIDKGYEAIYLEGDGRFGQLYAHADREMSILATPNLEGTVLGFTPGDAESYTITFEGDGKGYYLNDVVTGESTLIDEANTYVFTSDESTNDTRFVVSKMPMKPTGVDEVADGSKARKQMIDGTLYIIRDGRIYDATGSLVK